MDFDDQTYISDEKPASMGAIKAIRQGKTTFDGIPVPKQPRLSGPLDAEEVERWAATMEAMDAPMKVNPAYTKYQQERIPDQAVRRGASEMDSRGNPVIVKRNGKLQPLPNEKRLEYAEKDRNIREFIPRGPSVGPAMFREWAGRVDEVLQSDLSDNEKAWEAGRLASEVLWKWDSKRGMGGLTDTNQREHWYDKTAGFMGIDYGADSAIDYSFSHGLSSTYGGHHLKAVQQREEHAKKLKKKFGIELSTVSVKKGDD